MNNKVLNAIKEDFMVQLEAAGRRLGRSASKDFKRVGAYAGERAKHLAKCYGKPGFDEAVEAEKDNVLLFAGMSAAMVADETDAELKGLMTGMLSLEAKLLVLV